MKSIKSPEFSTNYPTPDSSIQYLFDEQIDVDLSCPKCTNPRTSDRWCNHCESKRFNEGFMNWTSNNAIIDEFIRDTQRKATNKRDYLVWIDYDKIEDVKYLAKGGFGEIYCGIWVEGPNRKWVNIEGKWDLQARTPVALKSLYNSKDWTEDFLNELQAHYKFRNGRVLHCYGVTQDKVSSNYMLVMEFANGGDLRHYLSRNNSLLSWGQKLLILKEIALGLEVIHSMKLIHRDFHSGNILQDTSSDGTIKTFVADLGLCRPVNRTLKSISEERDVYGVLSYIAPEILRRTHDYSEASDNYGFGMIMWEVLHDKPPFHNVPHDVLLALEICKGVRPKVERRAPKWYFSLMIKCWDADPSKRPEILEIRKTIQSRYCDERDRDLAAEHLSTGNIDSGFSQTSHPEAIFASRLLNFSNLPDSGDVLDISEYSIYFCDGEQVEDEANKENDYITRAYDDSLSNHL